MRYINHKSDFQVIINIKDKEGNIVAPPSVPWEAVFADENGCEFTCCFDGTNYTHCIVDFSDIVCFVDNPGFSCGNLRCTFCQHVPSAEYCDGVMDLTQPLQCDIMLSKRESDDSTPITIEASPNWVRGPQGEQGIQGLQGVQGVKGDDGVSPTVKTSKTGKVTTIEITDAQGTHTATVNDGESVEVVQSTGNSTTSVMSQKAVSDALSTKADKTELDSYATKEYVQTNAPQETKESIEEKLGAWLEEDGGEADGEVYTKAESDARYLRGDWELINEVSEYDTSKNKITVAENCDGYKELAVRRINSNNIDSNNVYLQIGGVSVSLQSLSSKNKDAVWHIVQDGNNVSVKFLFYNFVNTGSRSQYILYGYEYTTNIKIGGKVELHFYNLTTLHDGENIKVYGKR